MLQITLFFKNICYFFILSTENKFLDKEIKCLTHENVLFDSDDNIINNNDRDNHFKF